MAPTIETIEHWKALGAVAPSELSDARKQVHYAVQTIASIGVGLIEKDEENLRHITTEWLDGPMILASARFGGALPIQVGVRASKLQLQLQDAENMELITAFPLDGKTLDQAYAWLEETLAKLLGITADEAKLRRTPYELPEHELSKKRGRFSYENPETFVELEKWIGNGYHAVQAVESCYRGATEVRCHPQHFDMTSLLRQDPEGERTIRIGLCHGDTTYDEPYFYATPWPQPGESTVPSLGRTGDWNLSGGWFGAVCRSSVVLTSTDPESQAGRVASFWNHALDACEQLLPDPPKPDDGEPEVTQLAAEDVQEES